MIAALTGLLAGAVHVFAGPDHLTAIAPLAMRKRYRGWVAGLRWGIGHTAGVFLVGGLSLWLRDALPVDLISAWGERLVGVVLFAIGLWALRQALNTKIHTHEHDHADERHVHFHAHAPREQHEAPVAHVHKHTPFAIGTLHGLAGSSHVLGILPMLALPTKVQAVSYLLAFGVGTVAAMALFSGGIGMLAARCASTSLKFYRGLMVTCSVAAIVVGGVWISGNAW